MTNDEKIAIINSFQTNPFVHPLTCGVNSLHENLVPITINDEVVLICPDCDYTQPLQDDFLILLSELDLRQREFGHAREAIMKQHRYVKEY